jgi:hypothetical protein
VIRDWEKKVLHEILEPVPGPTSAFNFIRHVFLTNGTKRGIQARFKSLLQSTVKKANMIRSEHATKPKDESKKEKENHGLDISKDNCKSKIFYHQEFSSLEMKIDAPPALNKRTIQKNRFPVNNSRSSYRNS